MEPLFVDLWSARQRLVSFWGDDLGVFFAVFFLFIFEGVSNPLLFDFWSFLALKMAPKCAPNRAKIDVKSGSENFLFLGPIFR